MATDIYVVDAFTSEPFKGNPAAICLLNADPGDASWMQQVAAEMNLSETAFVWRIEDHSYGLRWFTPQCEVKLCGHATLAAAHVLWQQGWAYPEETIRFETLSGTLEASRAEPGIWLDFPAIAFKPCSAPHGLAEGLGVAAKACGQAGGDFLLEVDCEAFVRRLSPDFTALSAVETRGVIVTAKADGGSDCDFVSRFFAPRFGINEDPVTGSAHCSLAPYWGERLGLECLKARQLSARGGELTLELCGARVGIGGQAITMLSGEIETGEG